MQANPTSKPRSVEQIESEIIAFYQESLQAGDDVHVAVARTAIKFEMHWATIKMVVGA
jgi:hypothetical protein